MSYVYPSPPTSPSPKRVDITPDRRIQDSSNPSRILPFDIPTPPATPPKDGPVSTKPLEQPAVAQIELDATTLEVLLGLDSKKCGSATKGTNGPCRGPRRSNDEGQIDAHISSLLSLTQSSPELVPKLEKLIDLVHCRWHFYGKWKDGRVEAWTKAFPVGAGQPAIPVEEQIRKQVRKLLDCVSSQCASGGGRCSQKIGGQKVLNCTRTVTEILKPEVYQDDDCLEELLEVLETNMYCRRHVSNNYTKVTAWKAKIIEIRAMATSHMVHSPKKDVPETLITQSVSTASGGVASVLQRPTLPTPKNSRSISRRAARDPASYWPDAYETSAFIILRPSMALVDPNSSYSQIQKQLMRPLAADEKAYGYVYLYKVEGNDGFVKIGYTSRTIAVRSEEWKFECNRKPKVVYPAHIGSAILVPNAKRIEALCHAELEHRNITVDCKACLKPHIEWFEVSAADAIAVIQKWSKWMNTYPYIPSKTLRSGGKVGGILKDEEMSRTRDMTKFMKEITGASSKEVKRAHDRAKLMKGMEEIAASMKRQNAALHKLSEQKAAKPETQKNVFIDSTSKAAA